MLSRSDSSAMPARPGCGPAIIAASGAAVSPAASSAASGDKGAGAKPAGTRWGIDPWRSATYLSDLPDAGDGGGAGTAGARTPSSSDPRFRAAGRSRHAAAARAASDSTVRYGRTGCAWMTGASGARVLGAPAQRLPVECVSA